MNADPMPDPPRLRDLFLRALELPTPEARAELFAAECGDDAALRQRLEALLARHTSETFLAEPAIEPGPAAHAADAPEAETPGTFIGGRYRLLEKIGEGGFGSVWMAEQEEPVRRRVALKIVKLGMDTREVVARFEAERQALALMDHPGIARVFDGGATERGRPFFVMELVRGTAITEYCERHRLGIRERIGLFIEVCEAVQHAHQKGVIHRDLKPSNVLVAEIDGRPRPKVIDFGVAKATAARLTPDTVFTRFQQVIGTPAYMSPEQAGGAPDDIDTRSDIYSLGVLLYELLTGRTPFDTRALLVAGFEAVLRVIRDEDPPRPSTRLGSLTREHLAEVASRRQESPDRLGRLVRGELDWIAMRALEKDRARRYPTAQGFARDLVRFLNQEPVDAAPPSFGYRVSKFVRRNRTPVGTLAAIALILVTATFVSLRLAVAARLARDQAATERDRALRAEQETGRQRTAAEANATESRQRLVRLTLGNGQLQEERGDAYAAALWYAAALRQAPDRASADDEDPRRRLESLLTRSPSLTALLTHDGPVRAIRFSPRGDRLVSASDDGTARVWDAETGQPLGPPLRHAGPVRDARFTDDGTRVLTHCEDGTARVWNVATGQPITPPLAHRLPLKRVRFSKDETLVLTASGRAALPVVPPALPAAGHGHGHRAGTEPASEASGHRAESEIRIWDAITGQEARPVLWRNADVLDLVVDRASGRFATSFADGALSLWSLSDQTEWVLRQPTDRVPGGPQVAPGSPTWFSDPRVSAPSAHHSLAFVPNGHRLLTATEDGTLGFWIIPGDRLGAASPGPRFPAGPLVPSSPSTTGIAVDPTSWRVASLEREGMVRLWNPVSGESAGRLPAVGTAPGGIAFSLDGQLLVGFGGEAGAGGNARVWEVATGQPATPTFHHGAVITDADLHGARLATAGADGTIRIWSLASPLATTPPDVSFPRVSPETWQTAAELLAARTLGADGTLHPLAAPASKSRWETLQAAGFAFPTATPDRLRAWHERMALQAETHGQWQAAVLHLDGLASERPADASLQGRLSRARTRAALAALEQNL